jgi:hypothetical protein
MVRASKTIQSEKEEFLLTLSSQKSKDKKIYDKEALIITPFPKFIKEKKKEYFLNNS